MGVFVYERQEIRGTDIEQTSSCKCERICKQLRRETIQSKKRKKCSNWSRKSKKSEE